MIVRPHEGGLLLLSQEQHAHLSGWMAQHLRDAPEPRAEFAAAAGEHDCGWREWDEQPRLDEKGRPIPYTAMPREEYLGIWKRGTQRVMEKGEYVGLLVSLHGTRMFEKRPHPEDRAFYSSERVRQDDLLRSLALGGHSLALPEPVRHHHAWLGFLDGLSLFALDLWRSPWVSDLDGLGSVEARRELGEIVVEPWPFDAPSLRCEVPGRWFPRLSPCTVAVELRAP